MKNLLRNFMPLICILFCANSFSQPGTLDSTFGINGFANVGFTDDQRSIAYTVAIQPDGKIITAGAKVVNTDGDYVLMRFKRAGILDSSFGTNGIVITSFGINSDDNAMAVAIQSDGKIVAAGTSYQNQTLSVMSIARYNPDGSLDSSFGGNGKNILFTTGGTGIRCMALQSDGKIVAGGDRTYFNGTFNERTFFTARLNTNGYPDSTYGTNGAFQFNIHLGNSVQQNFSYGNKIIIAAGNKIIFGGDIQIGSNSVSSPVKPVIMKIKTNGTPDSSFGGGDGWNFANIGTRAFTQSIALQADGSIVSGGMSSDYSSDFLVIRYLSNGSLDNSFGTGGYTIKDVGGKSNNGYAIVVNDENKILLAGTTSDFATQYNDFSLLQFNENGSPDSTFGLNGVAVTEQTGCRNNAAFDMALTDNEDIILAGRIDAPPCVSSDYQNIGLAKVKGGSNVQILIKKVAVTEGNEGVSVAAFKVKLDKPSTETVSINYSTVDGNATGGSDYLARTGVLNIAPGQTTGTIKIGVIADTLPERNEKFYVQLSNPINGTIIGEGNAACTIINDDITFAVTPENADAVAKTVSASITPNPVYNSIIVNGLDDINKKTLSIIDINGKVVKSTVIKNSSYNWNISFLSAGIYNLVITENGKQPISIKFIKK